MSERRVYLEFHVVLGLRANLAPLISRPTRLRHSSAVLTVLFCGFVVFCDDDVDEG